MNEYEYINDAIARETAYSDGYEAGKQAAAEQIFADLEKIGGFNSGQLILFAHEYKEIKKKYGIQ